MRQSLSIAAHCIATPTAFCIGAIIVTPPSASSPRGEVLSTGYSRELEGNTHAEECAIKKYTEENGNTAFALRERTASIYTTMEPCSVRLSGNTPCVDSILSCGFIGKVYVGVEEPTDFVVCEGVAKLRRAGIEVFVVVEEGLSEDCLKEARRGH